MPESLVELLALVRVPAVVYVVVERGGLPVLRRLAAVDDVLRGDYYGIRRDIRRKDDALRVDDDPARGLDLRLDRELIAHALAVRVCVDDLYLKEGEGDESRESRREQKKDGAAALCAQLYSFWLEGREFAPLFFSSHRRRPFFSYLIIFKIVAHICVYATINALRYFSDQLM